jgi:hypothetical protein
MSELFLSRALGLAPQEVNKALRNSDAVEYHLYLDAIGTAPLTKSSDPAYAADRARAEAALKLCNELIAQWTRLPPLSSTSADAKSKTAASSAASSDEQYMWQKQPFALALWDPLNPPAHYTQKPAARKKRTTTTTSASASTSSASSGPASAAAASSSSSSSTLTAEQELDAALSAVNASLQQHNVLNVWHLHGSTAFGDNIDDEWLIVWLLLKLSAQPGLGLSVRVTDADGEFLLIEASDVIPNWVDPSTAANRVWIRRVRCPLTSLCTLCVMC